MGKYKIIAIVIWIITLVGPMKSWMFADFGTGVTYLVMFLLTVVGVFTGSYFFSKTTDSKVA
ncbi:MAG: hypothetical protein ACJAWO_001048 [Halieaceae bacterium]|jgi:hypothetical protein